MMMAPEKALVVSGAERGVVSLCDPAPAEPPAADPPRGLSGDVDFFGGGGSRSQSVIEAIIAPA